MKKALRYVTLYIVCFLISAAAIAVLELITTSTVDVEKVLTISIGTSLSYGTIYLLRLRKKESTEATKKK